MGCDIHLYGEKKITPKWFEFWKKQKWVSIDKWSNNEDYPEDSDREFTIKYEERIYTDGRNYNLFCALAGVRSWEFLNAVTPVSNPKGIPINSCSEIINEVKSWDSDGHSHSFLTLKELMDYDWSNWGKTCDRFKSEVFPKLQKGSSNPDNVRIVFFFDN